MPGETHVMRCGAFGNGAIFLEPRRPLTMGDFFLGLDQQFTSCDGMGKSAFDGFCHLIMFGIDANGQIGQGIGSGDFYLHLALLESAHAPSARTAHCRLAAKMPGVGGRSRLQEADHRQRRLLRPRVGPLPARVRLQDTEFARISQPPKIEFVLLHHADRIVWDNARWRDRTIDI